MLLEYMTQLTSEALDYVVGLDRWLRQGETIVAARATTSPNTLTALQVTFTGTQVVVRLAGGAARARYTVTVYVTTSTGQVKVAKFGIQTISDGDAVLPLLSISGGTVVVPAAAPPQPNDPTVVVYDLTVVAQVDEIDPGPDPVPGELFTNGPNLVDADNQLVTLRSINWFGAESSNNFPHGIWARSYKDIVDQIAAWGFNCIRIPFSGDTFRAGETINGVLATEADNLAFITGGTEGSYTYVTPFQAMDIIIGYAATKGLYVVLDHHRREAGAGADGAPTSGSYTNADWLATWTAVASHYADATNVIGADLHNEPHDLEWAAWATAAEGCAAAIHEVAPHWLIFVEGVGAYDGDGYWWGGALQGVRDRPVVLGVADKLVYSPHEYGQSVGIQPWLAYDGNSPPANWPNNLPDVFRNAWGFIAEEGIAPLWIGEFGGKFGRNGAGAADASVPHGTFEAQWVGQLATYINLHGVNFAYWSLNPNSGDTGGLLCDDWTTPQTYKLGLLSPLLPGA